MRPIYNFGYINEAEQIVRNLAQLIKHIIMSSLRISQNSMEPFIIKISYGPLTGRMVIRVQYLCIRYKFIYSPNVHTAAQK